MDLYSIWFILWFIFKEYGPENCFLPPSSLWEKIGPHALKNLTGGLRRFRYTTAAVQNAPVLDRKMGSLSKRLFCQHGRQIGEIFNTYDKT
jgi:hypothetical protein